MEVHLLWFVRREQDDDDGLLLGVYSSSEQARAAIEKLNQKPGFRDHAEGFQVHSRTVDEDYWPDGFVISD